MPTLIFSPPVRGIAEKRAIISRTMRLYLWYVPAANASPISFTQPSRTASAAPAVSSYGLHWLYSDMSSSP